MLRRALAGGTASSVLRPRCHRAAPTSATLASARWFGERNCRTHNDELRGTEFLRPDELPGNVALGNLWIDGAWLTNMFHLPVRGNGDGGVYSTLADGHAL